MFSMVFSFISSFVGSKLMVGLAVALALVAGSFYLYWNWSQDQLQIAAANQAKLEIALDETTKAIKFQIESTKIQTKRLDGLYTDVNEIRRETSELSKIFSRHDFSNLVKKKPKLLERRQNDATQRLFDELETITNPETYDD